MQYIHDMKCRQNTDMWWTPKCPQCTFCTGVKNCLDGQKLLKAGMHQDLFQQNQDVLSALLQPIPDGRIRPAAQTSQTGVEKSHSSAKA